MKKFSIFFLLSLLLLISFIVKGEEIIWTPDDIKFSYYLDHFSSDNSFKLNIQVDANGEILNSLPDQGHIKFLLNFNYKGKYNIYFDTNCLSLNSSGKEIQNFLLNQTLSYSTIDLSTYSNLNVIGQGSISFDPITSPSTSPTSSSTLNNSNSDRITLSNYYNLKVSKSKSINSLGYETSKFELFFIPHEKKVNLIKQFSYKIITNSCQKIDISNYWNYPSRWNLNRIPSITDDVVISSNSSVILLQNNIEINSLKMNGGKIVAYETSCPDGWTLDENDMNHSSDDYYSSMEDNYNNHGQGIRRNINNDDISQKIVKEFNGKKCYKLVDTPMNFWEAESYCHNQLGRGSGSHLIHIANRDELDLLYRLCRDSKSALKTQKSQDFTSQQSNTTSLGCWIGMYDYSGYGDFNWIDPIFSLDTTKLTEKSSDELFMVKNRKNFYDWRRYEPDNYTYFSPTAASDTFLTKLNDISKILPDDFDDTEVSSLSYTSNEYLILLIDKLRLNEKESNTLLLSGERCVSTYPNLISDPLYKEQGGWIDSFCFLRKPFICQLISSIKRYKLKINSNSNLLSGSIEGGKIFLYGDNNVIDKFILYRNSELYLYGKFNKLLKNLSLLDSSKLFTYTNLLIPSSTSTVFLGEPTVDFPLNYNYFYTDNESILDKNSIFAGEYMDGLAQSAVNFGTNSNIIIEANTNFTINAVVEASGLIVIEENSNLELKQGGDLSSSSIELIAPTSNILFNGYSSLLSIYDSFELTSSHNGVVLGEYFTDSIMEKEIGEKNKPFGVYRILVSVKRIYEDEDEYQEEVSEGDNFKIFDQSNFIYKEEMTSCIPYDAPSSELKNILEDLSIVKELGGVNIRRVGNKNLEQYGYGYTYRIEFNKSLRKKFFNTENLKYYNIRLNLNIGCYGDEDYTLTKSSETYKCSCGETLIPMKSRTSTPICKLPIKFNTNTFYSYSSSPISSYYYNNDQIVDSYRENNLDPFPEPNPNVFNYIDDSNLNSYSIFYNNLHKFINKPSILADNFELDIGVTSNINSDSCILAPYLNIQKLSTNSFLTLSGEGSLKIVEGYHRLPEIITSEVNISLYESSIGIAASDFILFPYVTLNNFSKLYFSGVGWNGWDSFIYLYESEEWKNERSLVNYLISSSTSLVYIEEMHMKDYSNCIITSGENYVGNDQEYRNEFYDPEFFIDNTVEAEGYSIESNLIGANVDNLNQYVNQKFEYEGGIINDISEDEENDLINANLILSKRDVAYDVVRSNLFIKKINFNGGIYRGKASIFITETLNLGGSLKGFADGLFFILTSTGLGEWTSGNITMSNGSKFILEGYLKVKNILEVDEDEEYIDEVIRFDIENENINDSIEADDSPFIGTISTSSMNSLEITETNLINQLNYQNVNYKNILKVSPINNFNSYYSENLLVKKQQNLYRNPACSYYCGKNSYFIIQKNANFTVLNNNNLIVNLNFLLLNSTNRVILKDISKLSLQQNSLLNNLATVYLLTQNSILNFYSNSIFMLKMSKIYGDGNLIIDSGSHTIGSIINCNVQLYGGEIIWPKSRQSMYDLGLSLENDNKIIFNKNLILEKSSKFLIFKQNTVITIKQNLILSDDSRIQFPLIGTVKERISYDSLDAPDDTPRCLLTVLKNFYFYSGIIEGKGDFIIKSYLLLDNNDKYKELKELYSNTTETTTVISASNEDIDAALFPEYFSDSTSSISSSSSNKYIKSLAKLVNDGYCEWNSGDIMITDFGDFINRGTIQIIQSTTDNKVLSAFYKGTAVSLENGGDYFAKDYHTYDIDPGNNLDFSEYLKLKSMYA